MSLPMRTMACSVLAVTLLSGCSLFSSDNKPKPTELSEIQKSVEVRQLWERSVSDLGGAVLRPAVVNSSVYAAGENGTLVRLSSGQESWRIRVAKDGLVGGVAANDSTVVVGSQKGRLLAFDAESGVERWNIALVGEISGTPFVDNDLVVVRVGASQLFAYDLKSGVQRWTYQRAQTSLSLRAYSGFTRFDNMLLAGFPGGKLVALSLQDGAPRWEATVALPRGSNELERMSDVTGEAVRCAQMICSSAFQGRTVAIDPRTGEVKWSSDLSSPFGVDADGKSVYLTDSSGAVSALDATTGLVVWKQEGLLHRGAGRAFASSENFVVVGDAQGWLHFLDKGDGHFVGRVKLGNSAVVAPLVAYGEGFVTQTRNGTVSALAAR